MLSYENSYIHSMQLVVLFIVHLGTDFHYLATLVRSLQK